MIGNNSTLSESELAVVEEVGGHRGLGDVLAWAAGRPKCEVHPQTVAEMITQDEFAHDVIMPYRNIFLVYDTT